MKGSLGLIETRGFVPAIAAADAGVKAANVSLLECKLTWPALVTITFQGDVAAVRAAVASGGAAANAVGEVVSTHVIARAHAAFDHVTPPPFTGQDAADEGQQQKKILVVPTAQQEPQTKTVAKRTVKKRTTRASVKQKAATVKKRTIKPAPAKKVAPQVGNESAQGKAVDVEAGVHDTDTTDKKVAAGTGTVEKRTEKKAAESAQQTGAARSATKTTQRKRAVTSRKRPLRKRQAATRKTTSTAPSVQSTAEKGKAATGESSPEKSKAKPTDEK